MKRMVCAMLIVLGGCASLLPVVTPDDVHRAEERWPGTTKADLDAGRQVYVDRCGSCHSLHLPSERTDAQWRKAVEQMQVRAKVSSEEKEQILRYLAVARMR